MAQHLGNQRTVVVTKLHALPRNFELYERAADRQSIEHERDDDIAIAHRLTAMRDLERPIVNRMQVRVHTGTADALGEMVLLDHDELGEVTCLPSTCPAINALQNFVMACWLALLSEDYSMS